MKYGFIFSILILILGSCQSDNDVNVYSNPYTDLSPEEYLKNYTTPEVMFHYMEMGENATSVSGLLIDNKGNIYKYQSESPVINMEKFTAPVSNLVMILTHSEKLKASVDLEDLVSHYKMTRKVDLKLQEAVESTRSEDFYFVGYDVTHDSEGNETCNVVGVSGNIYIQKLFKSSDSVNKSSNASKIVKWMASVLDKSDA